MDNFAKDPQQLRDLLKNLMGTMKLRKATQGASKIVGSEPESKPTEKFLQNGYLTFITHFENDRRKRVKANLPLRITKTLLFLTAGFLITIFLGFASSFWFDLGLIILGLGAVQVFWLGAEQGYINFENKDRNWDGLQYRVFKIGYEAALLFQTKQNMAPGDKVTQNQQT